MNHEYTLVTAIYHHLPTSRIGGRGYTWEDYIAPFHNILKLDCNLVVYTQKELVGKIEKYLKSNSNTKYKIITHDLNSYKHSNSIYRLKEESKLIDKQGLVEGRSLVDNDRNHHLCLSKTWFLQDSITSSHFSSEYFFWIDAGLFHHGLIPESLGGIERRTKVNINNYWPVNSKAVCNPTLVPTLVNKIKDQLLLLGLDKHYGRPGKLIEDNLGSDRKITHIIGGLFGGKVGKVLELCRKFEDKVSYIFEKNYLTLEEEVLSILYEEDFIDQNHIGFTDWGHDKPKENNYLGVKPGSKSFYKIFQDE